MSGDCGPSACNMLQMGNVKWPVNYHMILSLPFCELTECERTFSSLLSWALLGFSSFDSSSRLLCHPYVYMIPIRLVRSPAEIVDWLENRLHFRKQCWDLRGVNFMFQWLEIIFSMTNSSQIPVQSSDNLSSIPYQNSLFTYVWCPKAVEVISDTHKNI